MNATVDDDVRRAWDRVAPEYDEHVTPCYFGLGARILRDAGLQPGMRLLDVASGTGALALAGAQMGAQVTAVDISPVMIERLRMRAEEEALAVDARVMDGQALDLPDARFDIVASEFGVMLFPDLPRGLREMARVTRPGGKVVVVALGHPSKVEFFQVFVGALQAVAPGFTGPPADPLPLPFQVQDPEKLRAEMAAAGLRDIRVQQDGEPLTYSSGQQFWAWVMGSNPLAAEIVGGLDLTPEQVAAAISRADSLIRERAGGVDFATLVSPINIGIGTR